MWALLMGLLLPEPVSDRQHGRTVSEEERRGLQNWVLLKTKKIHDEFLPFYGLSPSVSDPGAVFLNFYGFREFVIQGIDYASLCSLRPNF
jgi:hypothetical protein